MFFIKWSDVNSMKLTTSWGKKKKEWPFHTTLFADIQKHSFFFNFFFFLHELTAILGQTRGPYSWLVFLYNRTSSRCLQKSMKNRANREWIFPQHSLLASSNQWLSWAISSSARNYTQPLCLIMNLSSPFFNPFIILASQHLEAMSSTM